MSKKINPEKRKTVFNKYIGRCAYCGLKLESEHFQVDHIIPQSRGGNNKVENLNPSCRSCNASKSSFLLEDWRDWIYHKVDILRRDNSNFRFLEKFRLIKVIKNKSVVFYFEKHEG